MRILLISMEIFKMTREQLDSKIAMWLAEPLEPEVSTAIQRTLKSEDVQYIAIMPDVHLAGDVCNGTVVATNELIYPQAVGSDIGTVEMLAVAIDLDARAVVDRTRGGSSSCGTLFIDSDQQTCCLTGVRKACRRNWKKVVSQCDVSGKTTEAAMARFRWEHSDEATTLSSFKRMLAAVFG